MSKINQELRNYLSKVIPAAERAAKNTGYKFHKGGLKAYRDCLRKLDEIDFKTEKENVLNAPDIVEAIERTNKEISGAEGS